MRSQHALRLEVKGAVTAVSTQYIVHSMRTPALEKCSPMRVINQVRSESNGLEESESRKSESIAARGVAEQDNLVHVYWHFAESVKARTRVSPASR